MISSDKDPGQFPDPKRVEVLKEAAALTGGDRNETYGSPKSNLDLAGAMYKLYKTTEVRPRGLAHDAALMQVFAKLSRICTGPGDLHRDNYVDLAAYASIAYEVASQYEGEA
jgi:hypothetical protein